MGAGGLAILAITAKNLIERARERLAKRDVDLVVGGAVAHQRPRVVQHAISDSNARVLAVVDRLEVMLRGLRRDLEHGPAILRRLTELERLVRGDPGLAKAPHHSRRRPAGC